MPEDDITLGELGRRIDAQYEAQRAQIAQLDAKIDGVRADGVLRAEYEARMVGLDREIRDVKARLERPGTPWPVYAAFAVSALALLLSYLPKLAVA